MMQYRLILMGDKHSLTRRAVPAALGLSAASLSQAQPARLTGAPVLPSYAQRLSHRSLRQSSYDVSGGNADRWVIAPGQDHQLLRTDGPGLITHLWFTIASQSPDHLKELVLRAYWDGSAHPSVEVPVGDFFGLNLGTYNVYQSAFLNCSSRKALNCYFAMPFHKTAVLTITNEGSRKVDAFYSNIDYQLLPQLPAEALYFHAQYRQATPNVAVKSTSEADKKNLDGAANYVFLEATGIGHLMGVTLGVVQNAPRWMGEGDDMTFIDNSAKPAITGTGTEDYFCGAWNFGGPENALPFAHLYHGAHLIDAPEQVGGRYCLYRWHADNPITFDRSLKHTLEHGHANDRADSFCSVAYWYQTEPASGFPALPTLADRKLTVTVVR